MAINRPLTEMKQNLPNDFWSPAILGFQYWLERQPEGTHSSPTWIWQSEKLIIRYQIRIFVCLNNASFEHYVSVIDTSTSACFHTDNFRSLEDCCAELNRRFRGSLSILKKLGT